MPRYVSINTCIHSDTYMDMIYIHPPTDSSSIRYFFIGHVFEPHVYMLYLH